MCRHVLVVTGDKRLTGLPPGGAAALLAQVGHPEFEQPYGLSVPAAYALIARRYMHEYGVSPEELAAIAVTQREHAALHPHAHMRDRINDSRCHEFTGDQRAAQAARLLSGIRWSGSRRRQRKGGERQRSGPGDHPGLRPGPYARAHLGRTVADRFRLRGVGASRILTYGFVAFWPR